MNKPKIAFLIPRLGVSDRGVEVFVYELSKRLVSAFTVSIFTRNTNKKSFMIQNLKQNGVRVIHIPCVRAEYFLLKFLMKPPAIPSLLNRLHLDPDEIEMLIFSLACMPRLLLMHLDLLYPNNGVWGALICRIIRLVKGVPFIYTSHGGIEPWIFIQRPNCYITTNTDVTRFLEMHFPNQRYKLIPNGVDTKRFTPKGKHAFLVLPQPVALAVSALIPTKRLDNVIRAIAKIPKMSLVILGRGPLYKELSMLATKLLGSKRFFITSVTNDRIPEYYRTSNVFIHASQNAPGDLAPLEALSSNVPVVVNKEDHLRQVVGNGGILVDVNNIDKMARAIKKALNTKWGYRPRRQALKYSWDDTAVRYRVLINDLIR